MILMFNETLVMKSWVNCEQMFVFCFSSNFSNDLMKMENYLSFK